MGSYGIALRGTGEKKQFSEVFWAERWHKQFGLGRLKSN